MFGFFDQIMEHHRGRLAKDTHVPTKSKEPEVRSVLFHDRDFDLEKPDDEEEDFWK